jgi:molybdate/tungstate transport system ATP-binding protein
LIVVEGLVVEAGGFRLEVERLEVGAGEYLVVLGPSGVGKTLLLHAIAGLVRPRRGRILVGGRDVTGEPPERRGVSLVPQDYGLFPHMSVLDNIAYGLRVRGWPRSEAHGRARRYAGLLGIGHLLGRRPPTLSGGEQQRVALARALAVEPEVLLLDEPLSSLDPASRISGRRLLAELHRRLGFTAVHVSHSIVDALVLADRVAYLEGGRLACTCGPREFASTPYAEPYLDEIQDALRALGPEGASRL